MKTVIQELNMENKLLREKVEYLETKIKQLISDQIQKNKTNNQLTKST